MVRRLAAVFLLFLPLVSLSARARDKEDPKPLDPEASIRPTEGEGYFDEVFGIDDAGEHLAGIRGDGATFSKIELYDLTAKPPKLTASFDPPNKNLTITRIELLPPGKGMVLIGREKAEEGAPLHALLLDASGKVV